MAKKELSLAEKAKLARDKASGTRKIPMDKKEGYLKGLKREVLTGKNPPVNREAKVLAKAGKINSTSVDYSNNITVKKVDSDAYRLLSNLAKGKALKGAEAEKAIQKVFKSVARTAGAERQRTATRGEAQVKRGKEKRSNTNLLK